MSKGMFHEGLSCTQY